MQQQNRDLNTEVKHDRPYLKYVLCGSDGPCSGPAFDSKGSVCLNGKLGKIGHCSLEILEQEGSHIDHMLVDNRTELFPIFTIFLDTLDGDMHRLAMVVVDKAADKIVRELGTDGSVKWTLNSDINLAENFEEIAEMSGGCVSLVGDVRSCFSDPNKEIQ